MRSICMLHKYLYSVFRLTIAQTQVVFIISIQKYSSELKLLFQLVQELKDLTLSSNGVLIAIRDPQPSCIKLSN